ncbi:aminotransferase class V-fold PLP-dependent enzyme [Fusibacter paucivorans]|uniref:Aminotransferase class V-fold PLP-dependent enzyme n=1 Tax=Fusibacter paucivorans TaxID=76009 RepID=A0ABS5PQ20_9FIRM|nr:aminotransferase class V-fold PLP-dependent enzyme [Fusibacter paucivorans]MBS7527141.1 aminotransferase class V-fold PLP-dependent enzyme [Fusibacter paucivorans]
MRLTETLEKIKAQHLVSFFMPGHKMGRKIRDYFPLSYENDITEIPDADYLHDPTGAILETEKLISQQYDSLESKMLVGGSTVGILSMILGSMARGDTIIVNRNAHKSVYHAIEMGGLKPVYLIPEMDQTLDIPVNLSASEIEALIQLSPDVRACLLTYPTYEGICYDVKSIIDVCHRHGILVLVDEAHGSHLMLSEALPPSALTLGADIVVQSFHKTLPALTQTACLHFGKNHLLNDRQVEGIKWHLAALQTSSPSYLLMGSVDAMLSLLKDQGPLLMRHLLNAIAEFESQMSDVYYLTIKRYRGMDATKLIVMLKDDVIKSGYDGNWLSETLRDHFGIQVEYAADYFCLLMTSVSNDDEDFEKLMRALKSMDNMIGKNTTRKTKTFVNKSEVSRNQLSKGEVTAYMTQPETVYSPSEAKLKESERCNIAEAEGKVSRGYIIPYPPGIPILVPGERITGDKIAAIEKYRKRLMSLPEGGIEVIK